MKQGHMDCMTYLYFNKLLEDNSFIDFPFGRRTLFLNSKL